jgi:hypothetical protein
VSGFLALTFVHALNIVEEAPRRVLAAKMVGFGVMISAIANSKHCNASICLMQI